MRWLLGSMLVAGIFGGITTMSFNGLCFRTLSFLSDEELIGSAIDFVTANSLHIIESPSGGFVAFSPTQQIPYRDRNDFRLLNPDCCTIIEQNQHSIGMWQRLFGQAYKSVHVRYTVNYVAENGLIAKMPALAERAVGNCGRILNLGH